jgi:hypothetical protein
MTDSPRAIAVAVVAARVRDHLRRHVPAAPGGSALGLYPIVTFQYGLSLYRPTSARLSDLPLSHRLHTQQIPRIAVSLSIIRSLAIATLHRSDRPPRGPCGRGRAG